MSENLLAKVTQGPMLVEDDGHPEKFGLRVVSRDLDIDVADLNCDPNDQEAVETTRADAELLALAYDHALLLLAVRRELASLSDGWVSVGPANDIRRAFRVEDDAFGCPALTPELRAALQTALGLESGK